MRDPDFDATFIKTTTAASQKSLLPSLEILTLQARRDDMSNNRNVLRTNVISRYDVGASKLAHLLRLLQHLVLSRVRLRAKFESLPILSRRPLPLLHLSQPPPSGRHLLHKNCGVKILVGWSIAIDMPYRKLTMHDPRSRL
ncbi:hypothetical protein BST61_g10970 [Cercospora zeina]